MGTVLGMNLAELVLVIVGCLVLFGGGFLYWVGLQEDKQQIPSTEK